MAKLAVNAGASLDAKTQAVYCSIWLEGLSDLSPAVLLAAFRKTLRECPYWPVKVADIRKHVAQAESNATDEAAEQAWEYVLELRRRFWNPDMPGGFSRGMPRLRDRIAQAARAAGVWRDFDSVADLHTWAKKRFLESFTAYGKQEENLLPDGPIKTMLQWFADGKAMPRYLPAPKQVPQEPPEERLRVADELAAAARKVLESYQPKEHLVTVSDETRKALHFQAELIKKKYPYSGPVREELRPYLEPGPQIPERTEDAAQ